MVAVASGTSYATTAYLRVVRPHAEQHLQARSRPACELVDTGRSRRRILLANDQGSERWMCRRCTPD